MDTFENGTLAEEQPEMVLAQCWECGQSKLCFEHLVCSTGTRFHTCPECRDEIDGKRERTNQSDLKSAMKGM